MCYPLPLLHFTGDPPSGLSPPNAFQPERFAPKTLKFNRKLLVRNPLKRLIRQQAAHVSDTEFAAVPCREEPEQRILEALIYRYRAGIDLRLRARQLGREIGLLGLVEELLSNLVYGGLVMRPLYCPR